MTVPFRVDPESVRRQAPQDPFLEFESERPSRSLLGEKKEEPRLDEPDPGAGMRPSLTTPSSDRVTGEQRGTSPISPSIAFAVGVAGLVTAAASVVSMVARSPTDWRTARERGVTAATTTAMTTTIRGFS